MVELTTEATARAHAARRHMDMHLVSASPEEVVGVMRVAPGDHHVGGAMHGGALMSLTDTIGGVVAFLNLPEGAGTSTISSSTVFLRGVREGAVTATGRLVHKGPHDDRGRDRADRRPGTPGCPYDADTVGADAADWVA